MAGDWIPMRVDLAEDPAVIGIAARLKMDEFGVVGRLHRLWVWANQQLKTGEAAGVSEAWVDRLVAMPGFAAAMIEVEWLDTDEGGFIVFPKFDRWNSQGAKRRLEKTQRKRIERLHKSGDTVARTRRQIPRAMRARVLKRDGEKCVNCGWNPRNPGMPIGLPGGDRLSIDHIFPESRGGETTDANLVTLCMACNQKKSDRTFEEAGMSPNLSHIVGDNLATKQRPEKRREEIKESPSEIPAADTKPPLKSPAERKPRKRDPLFDAVAEVTGADPVVTGSHIGKVTALLRKAEPPYTPEEVRDFGARFAQLCPWSEGRRPTIGEVEKNIGLVRAGQGQPQRPPPRGFETPAQRMMSNLIDAMEDDGHE